MSEMLERVRRSLADLAGCDVGNCASCDQDDAASCLRQAATAIRSMREPTEGMKEAAGYYGKDHSPAAEWRAMIDAALPGSV